MVDSIKNVQAKHFEEKKETDEEYEAIKKERTNTLKKRIDIRASLDKGNKTSSRWRPSGRAGENATSRVCTRQGCDCRLGARP